ncbi:MAG: homoserine kinase [Mariprofundaceae bacterium]
MSVYTELSRSDFEAILSSYELGTLQGFEGIAAGIENSNFFIDVDSGRYVLTIFERLDADELPYFMQLMKHLSSNGIFCPDVMVRKDGSLLFHFEFEGSSKYGCIVSCLPGKVNDALNEVQLKSAGEIMAQMHLAGQGFEQGRSNPTGFDWLDETIQGMRNDVEVTYGEGAMALLDDELLWQSEHVEGKMGSLPSGLIHGDYFVDNILYQGDSVSGVIDFYYAHTAPYIMDVAIAVNALAVQLGNQDRERIKIFLDGYQSVRTFESVELEALPGLLRLGALRFWASRLFDAINPRGGAMTQTKNPEEYRKKLVLHRAS